MVGMSVFGLILGVAVAQTLGAFAVVPTIITASLGTLLFNSLIGSPFHYSLLLALCVAVTLQIGFLTGLVLNGLVWRSSRISLGVENRLSTEPSTFIVSQANLDQSIRDLDRTFVTMKRKTVGTPLKDDAA